jgi:thiol-disulfide isomerase/thioredoxin
MDNINNTNSDTLTVLKFSAKWCAPCKVVSPMLKDTCTKLELPLTEYDADDDENNDDETAGEGVNAGSGE